MMDSVFLGMSNIDNLKVVSNLAEWPFDWNLQYIVTKKYTNDMII